MDSDESPDYVDRLARKYMQKCKVDSSTESESDTNYEGLSASVTHGNLGESDKQKLQFLDPYDGDSEDSCVYDLLRSDSTAPLSSPDDLKGIGEFDSLKATKLLKEKEPTKNWNILSFEASDVCMKSFVELDASVETTKESWHSSEQIDEPLDISMDSGVLTGVHHLNATSFILVGVDSRTAHNCGDSVCSVCPTSITFEENSDYNLHETSLTKRKLGVKMDYNVDKPRRKKSRVGEIVMV
ncbi:uncharacterized protein LOC128636249 [Bombina bombina]|uniref:uncharacterized protein LOC128636249 n=1 Tax=Bombina bombina TaxID=8345 RepID=UPI00235A63E3|nr:uncharacterized protein LOC128636249 [Bombina bombina]